MKTITLILFIKIVRKFNFLLTIILLHMLKANAQPFAGGSGTKADPYQISTQAQLDSVRNYLTAYFILTNDINLDIAPYNTGEGWLPIGNTITPFTGGLNGNGNAIKNLYINRPTTSFMGLFSITNNANIENIKISECKIIGNQFVAGLIGTSENDTVSFCNVSGNISSNNFYAGGLIAYIGDNSLIQGCYTTCNIFSTGSVGGIAYFCGRSKINNCYTSGTIYGKPNQYTGGLIGIINGGTISCCYSTSYVYGEEYVGGLIGATVGYSTVNNSYSAGYVNGSSNTGAFIGNYYGSKPYLGNNFYNIETSGLIIDIGLGTPKTTSEMRIQTTFTSWDFTNIWKICSDSTYPGLIALNNAPFAFNDSVLFKETITKQTLLENDFDIETKQESLVFKIIAIYGANSTDSLNWYNFSQEFISENTDSVLYRIGEALTPGDTLWGNYAKVIMENIAPVIHSVAPETGTEDSLYTYIIDASDANNDVLFYSLNNQPDGMTISDNVITWTPGDGQLTSGEVELIVSDGKLSDIEIFTVKVSPLNDSPEIISQAPLQATVGEIYIYRIQAIDPNDTVLYYSLTNAPDGMILEDTIISWTPSEGTTTSGEITLTVTDGDLSDNEVFTITVANPVSSIENQDVQWAIYPNPATDKLFIDFEDKAGQTKIQIVGIDGKVYLEKQIDNLNNNTISLDLYNLTSGVYYCYVLLNNKTEKIKSISQLLYIIK